MGLKMITRIFWRTVLGSSRGPCYHCNLPARSLNAWNFLLIGYGVSLTERIPRIFPISRQKVAHRKKHRKKYRKTYRKAHRKTECFHRIIPPNFRCVCVFFFRSRPGKPNQRKGQNEKLMNFGHFCEFWCFSLGKQSRFTFNFCSGMPLRKVHELAFLWFGLPG